MMCGNLTFIFTNLNIFGNIPVELFRRIKMKKGFTLVELLILVAIIAIIAAITIPGLVVAHKNEQQRMAWSHVDYSVLAEGKFEKAEYVFDGQQYTDVYFQDSPKARLMGVNTVGYDRGDRIRISQKRLGAGTKYEKLESSYKIELLEAEAK